MAAEPLIANVTMFAGNFAPRGWAFCSGQLLAISSNSALFSLIGCTYGGDCRTSMALPDLRGRVPVGSNSNSAGPGLRPIQLGERGGAETTTLLTQNLPSHSHTVTVRVSDNPGSVAAATGNPLGKFAVEDQTNQTVEVYDNSPAYSQGNTLGGVVVGNTGGNIPVNNLQPYLGINFIIALQGIFPSRS